MNVITNTAATGSNGIAQGFANRRDQAGTTFLTDAAGRTERRNPGAKKAFRSINIADANQQMPIHQYRLDRRCPPPRRCKQPVGRKFLGQRLDAKHGEQGVKERIIAFLPGDDAKTPGVGKTEQGPLGLQVKVVVLARRLLRRHEAQIARHAQMQDQPTATGPAVAAIKE